MRGQAERGMVYDAYKTRFDDYVAAWFTNHKTRIRTYTIQSYTCMIDRYILPELGKLKLAELTAARLQSMYDGLSARGISPQVIRNIHTVLSSCIKQAYQQGLMLDMPTKRVFLPVAKQAEMKAWNEAQVSAFLIAVRGDRYEALYHLALKLGLRRGELLGLQWHDIDWLKSTIHVRRQAIIPNKGKRSTAPPKTAKGRRVIPVGRTILELLRVQEERVHQMRIDAGEKWQEQGLVLPCSKGTPPSRIDNHFKKVAKTAGLPEIRFHDMRHTAASIMLANGIPIMVVSRILGHSSAAITLRVYGHLMPGGMEDAAALMDEVTAGAEIARELHAVKNETPIYIRK